MPLYKEDMDASVAAGCSAPDCDHKHDGEPLFVHGRCHPGAGIEAHYFQGELHVACAQCHAPIINVAVASRARLN